MAASQRLLVMPDDGAEAVVALIDHAQSQLLIKQFKLQSEAVEQALLHAQQRGVRIRVMPILTPPAVTAGTMRPTPCFKAGVWSWPGPASASW